MTVNDPGKLLILALALIGAMVLRGVGAIDDVVFVGIAGPIIGYVTGNGNIARKGEHPSPVIAPKPVDGEVFIHHPGPNGTVTVEPAPDVITTAQLQELADVDDSGGSP